MFDKDKFIELVQNQPTLWDRGCLTYSNRAERETCWIAVSKQVYPDWDTMDQRDREIKGKDLKNKWRHIRDEYLRQLHKSRNGFPPYKNKRKKYMWADALKFLEKSTAPRNASMTLDELGEQWFGNDETAEGTVDVDIEENQDIESDTDYVSNYKESSRRGKRTRMTPLQEELLKRLDETSDYQDDADRMFLLSILPDFKGLNDEDKLDFKILTLEFFRNIRQKKKLQFLKEDQNSPQSGFSGQN